MKWRYFFVPHASKFSPTVFMTTFVYSRVPLFAYDGELFTFPLWLFAVFIWYDLILVVLVYSTFQQGSCQIQIAFRIKPTCRVSCRHWKSMVALILSLNGTAGWKVASKTSMDPMTSITVNHLGRSYQWGLVQLKGSIDSTIVAFLKGFVPNPNIYSSKMVFRISHDGGAGWEKQ